MNQNTRVRSTAMPTVPATSAAHDLGDLSAVRGAVIGSAFGLVLWALAGLVFMIFRAAF